MFNILKQKVVFLILCNLLFKYLSQSELIFVCSLMMWIRSGWRRRGKETETYCASVVSRGTKYFISLATAINDGASIHIRTYSSVI